VPRWNNTPTAPYFQPPSAKAWRPPVFLPQNPFAPGNIPASAWVMPPPIFPLSPGLFQSAAPAPTNIS
jgi:hypothetical protein